MVSKQFHLQSYFDEVSKTCGELRSFLNENSTDKDVCDKIEICAAEALNNIIRHAYKGEEGKDIWMDVIKEEDKLTIIIKDEGIERRNPGKRYLIVDPDDIDALPEGGMGLFLINQIMDENNYKREKDKNIFTMIKYNV